MNKITPSVETVFSADYWGDAVKLPEEDSPRGWAEPFSVNRRQIHNLCAEAATAIFRGDDMERVPEGTTLDRSFDNRFTQPGTVVLIDQETLIPAKDDKPLKVKEPYWKSKAMRSPDELLAAPASLFRAHSYRGPSQDSLPLWREPRTIVRPYAKTFRNVELSMDYERLVALVVFSYDKDGKTRGGHEIIWKSPDPTKVVGDCRLKEIFSGPTGRSLYFPIDIGTTYEATRREGIIRIKSMDICLRGSLQYAGARRKLRLPRFAGSIASAPQPT